MNITTMSASSHKRKAVDDLPVLTAASLYDHNFPVDLFIRIGSFWTGKEFSTYLLAASSSKELSEDDNPGSHFGTTTKAILRALVHRCSTFLEKIDAPQIMANLLRERCDDAIKNIEANVKEGHYMQSVSKWCAFLDYCESTPLRLSESRFGKKDNEPTYPLWIVGYGSFGQSSTPSILSVPSESWRPELIFLGEKWMIDFVQQRPQLKHTFLMDPSDMMDNIGHTAAVMSWDSSDFLAPIHNMYDIAAGMLVYHEYPTDADADNPCYLNWLSNDFCQSFMGMPIRQALGKSNLKWMKEYTEYDNNMLAAVEIENSHIPQDHMDKFGERIIKLMEEVVTWYVDDDGESDEEIE